MMLRRIIQLVLILALLIGAGGCAGPGGPSPEITSPGDGAKEEKIDERPVDLSLDINFPVDGVVLETNLVKLTGTVSDPGANIRINYGTTQTEAAISENGNFYGWVDLPKGASTIEVVATRNDERVATDINVTFRPPLAVYVDWSSATPGSVNTVVATLPGYVTDPEARVTVNSLQVAARKEGNTLYTPVNWDVVIGSAPAEVSPDGFYSGKIELKFSTDSDIGTYYALMAEAARGAETDKDYTGLIMIKTNGEYVIGPRMKRSGPPTLNISAVYPELTSTSLKAGEKKAVPLLLNVKKDITLPELPHILSYKISAVDKEHSEVSMPVPEGLRVYLSPGAFTVWTMVDYRPEIVVETTGQVPPGKYWFFAEYFLQPGPVLEPGAGIAPSVDYLQGKLFRGWFNVVVAP